MRVPFFGNISGEKDERAQRCQELYDLADTLRQRQESEWYTNSLFLAGKHWEKAAEDVRKWTGRRPVYAPQTKVQLADNQILPLVRQAAAALRENIPKQIAIPATNEPEDIESAEIGTDFLEARLYQDNEEEQRFFDILWVMVTGQALRKTYWDPEAEYQNAYGDKLSGGEIVTQRITPFSYHLCPWADATQPAPWIIESDVRDIDEINALYPGHDVRQEDVEPGIRMVDRLLASVIEEKSYGSTPKRKEVALLKQLFLAPTQKQPNGKVFVWANGKLLDETELPEAKMPFVALSWLAIPGRLYPLPFVTPLVELQREINFTMSQLVELRNRQLRGDIATSGVGAVTQAKVFDDEGNLTGQKHVRLDPGITNFEFLKYDLRTTEAETLLLRLHNDMMQVAGIHESSLGQNPPRATTATQAQMLKESDLAGLTVFRTGLGLSYCKISQLLLLNAKNHYKTERMLRIVGANGAVEKMSSFYGSDLRATQDVWMRSTPIVTQTMLAAMKAEASTQGLYGPYAGPKDKLAKLTALINSGIPDVEKEVDALAAPMTMEELRQVVGEIDALEAQAAMLALQGQVDEMVIAKQMQEQQALMVMNPPIPMPGQGLTMPGTGMPGPTEPQPNAMPAQPMPMGARVGG